MHAHGEMAWKARMNAKVRDIFARIFETEDLACGLDMVTPFQTPDGIAERDNLQWLHVDQNVLTGVTHECYQSILYLWPSGGEDRSTTVVWPGSHRDDGFYGHLIKDSLAKERAGLRNACGIPFGHYLEVNQLKDIGGDALVKEAVASAQRIPVPAGSLLLWSSRTLHQGWKGGPRLAVPICWEPKDRVSAEARKRKLFMAAAGLPSSHSPSEALIHPCVASRRGDGARLKRPAVRPFSVLPTEVLPENEWGELWAFWEGEQFAEDLLEEFEKTEDRERALEKALKPEIAAAI